MDAFAQDRVRLTITVLCDFTEDWSQTTIELHGVDDRGLIALEVAHPETFTPFSAQLARTLLRSEAMVREAAQG